MGNNNKPTIYIAAESKYWGKENLDFSTDRFYNRQLQGSVLDRHALSLEYQNFVKDLLEVLIQWIYITI